MDGSVNLLQNDDNNCSVQPPLVAGGEKDQPIQKIIKALAVLAERIEEFDATIAGEDASKSGDEVLEEIGANTDDLQSEIADEISAQEKKEKERQRERRDLRRRELGNLSSMLPSAKFLEHVEDLPNSFDISELENLLTEVGSRLNELIDSPDSAGNHQHRISIY